MLNSYPIYTPPANNLRRNSLNPGISLLKSRRNSFSPSTIEEFFTNPPVTTNNLFPEGKDDGQLSFLDGLDLANNPEPVTLPDLSTPSPIISSPRSNIQCVRIIRRNDTAPISTNPNLNPRRVVRVIRVSNTPTTQSTSTSNVYIVRKTDLPPPTVQINPALKHVIAKSNNNSIDENNQINKLYGSTISIFGIEFIVVSNETEMNTNQCASLVQNMPDTIVKNTGQITNKVFDRCFIFSKEKSLDFRSMIYINYSLEFIVVFYVRRNSMFMKILLHMVVDIYKI